jgi:hypothetical protein
MLSWTRVKHGADLSRMIPALSAYMGQHDLGLAERYLRLTPERFRRQLDKLSPRRGKTRWRDNTALMEFLDSLCSMRECVVRLLGIFLAVCQEASIAGSTPRWATAPSLRGFPDESIAVIEKEETGCTGVPTIGWVIRLRTAELPTPQAAVAAAAFPGCFPRMEMPSVGRRRPRCSDKS